MVLGIHDHRMELQMERLATSLGVLLILLVKVLNFVLKVLENGRREVLYVAEIECRMDCHMVVAFLHADIAVVVDVNVNCNTHLPP